MSGLDPKGPSQPTQDQAYTTPGNPAQKDPTEQQQTQFNAADNSASVDQRIPTKQATDAQGLQNAKFGEGKGTHGAPAGEEAKGLTEEDVGRHNELDGEQMAAPGEGRVADAVAKGGKGMGGGGEQPDLASDLDRKKAEQADARDAIKQSRSEAVRAGGAAGQTGGPANPVDNQAGGTYPNSGS
ncbi:hypothetical protein EJ02DRAFT_394444 [Clathrospora elynae]|uniref:Uncharacterized protein n=1 Tax=Clathrospora elynae TaxID=706981 RepID=A0A6A5T135_9PLEO|nr:hypothetical protein EJ02DRAFT_394444 [Clathrospora elynae]